MNLFPFPSCLAEILIECRKVTWQKRKHRLLNVQEMRVDVRNPVLILGWDLIGNCYLQERWGISLLVKRLYLRRNPPPDRPISHIPKDIRSLRPTASLTTPSPNPAIFQPMHLSWTRELCTLPFPQKYAHGAARLGSPPARCAEHFRCPFATAQPRPR